MLPSGGHPPVTDPAVTHAGSRVWRDLGIRHILRHIGVKIETRLRLRAVGGAGWVSGGETTTATAFPDVGRV